MALPGTPQRGTVRVTMRNLVPRVHPAEDGEFVKDCINILVENVCAEKKSKIRRGKE